MSVNKRYLLDNRFIKQSFIDDMLSAIKDYVLDDSTGNYVPVVASDGYVLSAVPSALYVDLDAMANGDISSSLA